MNNPNIVAEITKQVASLKGARFASLTYSSKKSANSELARFNVNFGFSYHQVLEKSKTELEILMAENKASWPPLEMEAANEVMASLVKSLEAHARGEQNADYTKRGQYIPLGGGANLNTTDNTIQLFGLVLHKKVLKEGVFKKVNSAPLTVAKNKLRKLLPVGNFREFALDVSQVAQGKINGETFEMGSNGPEVAREVTAAVSV